MNEWTVDELIEALRKLPHGDRAKPVIANADNRPPYRGFIRVESNEDNVVLVARDPIPGE
jgi:hypothetical protein